MPSPDEWFERANELACEEGREAEAEAAYRASGTPDALRWLAWLLETHGRIEEAEAVYREAIDAGADGAWGGLGNLYRDTGRLDKAERAYRCDGGAPAAHDLAMLLHSQGRVEEAECHYRRALDAGEDVAGNFGLLLAGLDGRAGDAEPLLRAAIAAGGGGAWGGVAGPLR